MVRVGASRERRVTVPVRQALLAEPSCLERVVAVREPRIGGAHGGDQCIHRFPLDAVRQMAVVGDVGEAAPAVGDFLVLGERIGDQRELLHIVLEGRRQGLRGGLAVRRRAVLQQVQRRLDGQRLSQNLEAQIGDGRVE